MRFGQELVNYWYEGVAKGEEKRKKRRSKGKPNKSYKKNVKGKF